MATAWQDLPEPKNCFTVRDATMINLNTRKIIRHYSANTKIVVVQKYTTPEHTYYRTADAAYRCLNHAFEASAFGLPDEKAPLAPSSKPNSLEKHLDAVPNSHTPNSAEKTKKDSTAVSSKSGGKKRYTGWLKRIFRRQNG